MKKIETFYSFENEIEEKLKHSLFWNLTNQIYIDDSDPSYNWSITAAGNEWCTGNGSLINPYTIQNVIIDGQGFGSCIEIKNTNSSFIIRNCTVYNSYTGIKLVNTINGVLLNNNASDSRYGIHLHNSHYNNLSGNDVSNNLDDGLELISSDNNILSGNVANYNLDSGIYLWESHNNSLFKNDASYNDYIGLWLSYSNNNTCSETNAKFNGRHGIYLFDNHDNNIIRNNANYNSNTGLRLTMSHNNILSGNDAKYNEWHGIFFSESHENNIMSNNASYNHNGISLSASNNNIFSGNNASNNVEGILISEGENIILSKNIVNQNLESGMHLIWSDNNKIEKNIICHNSIGIYLDHSRYNYFQNNNLRNNGKDIQEISCEGNIFKMANISFEITLILILIIIVIILTNFLIGKRKSSRDREIITTIQSPEKEKLTSKDVITVGDLKKFFGNVKALNGISFSVHKGEIFGLLGPNGAGKTTTIKLLLRILEPDEGKINIFGINPELDEVQIKKRIGYVSEEPLIFKALTPKELFNFVASIRELDEIKTSKLAKDYLESFEANEIYEQLIDSLSHGNKQKLQIISALLHEPDLLILDEPLTGLDVKSVKVVKSILKFHTQRGGTILFSTHIMEIAQDLCDRIGIINKGKIVGIGTLEELRQQTDKIGASLEDIYLRLTEQDESVNEIVEKLRKSFKKIN